MVVSQDVTKKCFGFIPDLEKYEGVYTDQKLCTLWGISDSEWEYINTRINNIL
jgi:site-specific DNA-methyltransferase (adenine-specific)